MNNNTQPKAPVKPQWPVKIAKVVDEYTVVINKGKDEGIQLNQEVVIYTLGDEVLDPDTKKSLGHIEIVKGRGKIIYLQEHMAQVTSSEKCSEVSRIVRRNKPGSFSAFAMGFGEQEEIITPVPTAMPFGEVCVGDCVKPI